MNCLGDWLRESLGRAEEQSSRGRLDTLQEGNIKESGVGCRLVPKNEPMEKTNLAEQRPLSGAQGKKRKIYDLWKKR